MKQRTIDLLDMTEPEHVGLDITHDSKGVATLWVNIDGICRLRITKIPVGQFSLLVDNAKVEVI